MDISGSGGHYFTHLTRLLGMLDIQSETECLPEDALITGASSMSLASIALLSASFFFALCVSWLMVHPHFISPRLHRHTVLDETQCSLLKEMSRSALGRHKRKIISEHEFTNFLQNKLGKLCHQILSIGIPGTSAH